MQLSQNTREEIISDQLIPIMISIILIVFFTFIGYTLEIKYHNDWFARIGALLVGTGVMIDMAGIFYSLQPSLNEDPKIVFKTIKVAMLVTLYGTILWAFGDLFTVCNSEICLKIS